MHLFTFVWYVPRKIAMLFIKTYQKLFSPDHSFWAKKKYTHGYCRFYPSCSEYGYQVIKKRGLLVGGIRTAWRILRCNPWNKGGVDEPK